MSDHDLPTLRVSRLQYDAAMEGEPVLSAVLPEKFWLVAKGRKPIIMSRLSKANGEDKPS